MLILKDEKTIEKDQEELSKQRERFNKNVSDLRYLTDLISIGLGNSDFKVFDRIESALRSIADISKDSQDALHLYIKAQSQTID